MQASGYKDRVVFPLKDRTLNSSAGHSDQEWLSTMPVKWTSWKLPAAGPDLPTLKELCLSFCGEKKNWIHFSASWRMQEINPGMLMLHLLLTASVEGKAAVQIPTHTKSSVFLIIRRRQAITPNTPKIISSTYFLIIMLLLGQEKKASNVWKVCKWGYFSLDQP